MTFSNGHPIQPVGGRLALDFANTANWSPQGSVIDERIANLADVQAWIAALDLGAVRIGREIPALIAYRKRLRDLLTGTHDPEAMNPLREIEFAGGGTGEAIATGQRLEALLAVSALSILMDTRERSRVKMCPGPRCGWLFIDETRNGRRTWCRMSACGNRAKAARHYAKTKDESR